VSAIVRSVARPNIVLSALEEIRKRSQALLEKNIAVRFLDKAKNSQEAVSLVEQLQAAIVYHQVSGNHTL